MKHTLLVADWSAPPGVTAFCTMRETPVEQLPEFLDGVELPLLKQVHGVHVVNAEEALAAAEPLEADAVISRRPGLACRVQTADCLPILLCASDGWEVAAVHAGWRGLAAGVVERCLESMKTPASQLLAWIGPAIGAAAYEVGAELREAFLQEENRDLRDQIASCFRPAGDKYFADLPAIARRRLSAAGVNQVYGGELCTFSDPGRLHSYRRDGEAAGRLHSVIWTQISG